MTELYSIQTPNIYVTEGTKEVTSASATSNTSNTVFENQVEGTGNVDTAETNNTSNTQKATKRSAEELYKSIEALCTKYGLSYPEVKKFGLLERIAGGMQEDLLNLENAELQKILECLKAALEKLAPNGEKIDLEALAELAQDYHIAIHTGWTIKGFQEAQRTKKHESLKQRLERMYPGKSPEESLELYFNAYFEEQIKNKLAGETDPAKREQIIAQEKKRQLQDFGRLLANSSDEERTLFREAIKSLYANNRLTGFEALIKSLDTQEARTELADSCDPDYIESLQGKTDAFGENPSKDEVAGITQVIAKNQSEAGRREFHKDFEAKAKEFFEKNKDAIKRINEKIVKGEELTDEEKAIKEKMDKYFTPVSSGELIGTAQNTIIPEDAKREILQIINQDAFEKPNYREVLETTVNYINDEKNSNRIPPKEAIEALINETTNGNYQTVANDIQTDTKTELAEPIQTISYETKQTQASTAETQGSLGYTNSAKPVDTNYARTLTENLYNQTKPEIAEFESPIQTTNATTTPETFAESLKSGIQGIKEYASRANVSTKEITLNIFNSNNAVGNIIKEWALDKFEKMSKPLQKMTFKGIKNNSNAIAAAQRMSAEDLQKMNNFTNYYVKTSVEEIIDKKEKIAS